jgi:acetyl-CoA C-acetyltransferase
MATNRQHEAVILGSARTPQGKFLGALADLSAAQLGQVAVRAAVERSGINAADIDEVIIGNVVGAGVGQALPRQISIGAGIPDYVGGLTINKVCGSGLKSVMLAATTIKAELGDLFIAGGVESMSRAPYLNDSQRRGSKYGDVKLRDALTDGLWCTLCDWGMGNAAEFIGRQLDISRDAMDEFALRSHQLAAQTTQAGKFKPEIAPVTINDSIMDRDEPIRYDTSLEKLAQLKPAFEPDGNVTAGNAPGLMMGRRR